MSQVSDSENRLSELRARAMQKLDSLESSLQKESLRIFLLKAVQPSGDQKFGDDSLSSLSPNDIELMVHELRVYQTELELQNEQLRTTELELQKSRDDYFDLYDNAPAGYLTLTEKGLILKSNLEAAKMLGVGRTDLINKPLSAFMSEKEADTLYLFMKHGFAPGEHVRFEAQLIRPDQTTVYVQFDGSAVVDPDGLRSALRMTMSDMTRMKIAENELGKIEARWRLALEGASESVWDWNIVTNEVYYSSQWRAMLGYEDNEIGNSLDEWDKRIHPEDREKCYEDLKRHLSDETSVYENEHRLQCKDGSYKWVMDRGKVLEWTSGGKPLRMIGTHCDISQRKAAEEALRISQRELFNAKRLETLAIMAGGMAHNFNNILQGVLGYLELALEDSPSGTAACTMIEKAMVQAQRAAGISHQLLAYTGHKHFVPASVNVGELLEKRMSLFRSLIPNNVVLNVHNEQNLPSIRGDEDQLQTLIGHLVTNAYEAIGDNSGELNLMTGVMDCDESCLEKSRISRKTDPGRFVFLEVSDNGCGMDEETQSRVFDPFFTTKFLGRGLGMAEALGVVMGHNGALMLNSEQGKGTTVRVMFPIEEDVESYKGIINSLIVTEPPLPKSVGGPKTILIVDDEISTREVNAELINYLGYGSISASGGKDGLEKFLANQNTVDLILLDLMMPVMSGEVAFAEFKRICPDVKIIISSSYTQEAVAKLFFPISPDGFLRKPYRIRTLKDALDRLLGDPS